MSGKENSIEEDPLEQAGTEHHADTAAVTDPPQETELATLLEDARSKADENWNLCLRLQADLDNLHKRSERDLANAHKFALERFAQELLPVRDSLEMGLATSAVGQVDPDRLQEGVELTLQMLTTALGKFGITEINPQLERFNPDFHQAMSMQERTDVEPNTVVTVVQKGYLLNDRLLRPAMVIVSHAPRDTGGARDSGSPGEES
jgi:molecular chaperone GrpE